MPRMHKPSGRARLSDKGRSVEKRRAVNLRSVSPRFLIVCEGVATEKNYLESFVQHLRLMITVEVIGLGDNTLNLVNYTCKLMRQVNYTQVWCVFDRDSFPAGQFNAALERAQDEGIRVAYSNEAFELWYLLHFHYHDAATSRALYAQMLTERLSEPYHKTMRALYSRLLPRQPDAIRNAQRLLDAYGPNHNPERDNPCTTVQLLVQELNRHAR